MTEPSEKIACRDGRDRVTGDIAGRQLVAASPLRVISSLAERGFVWFRRFRVSGGAWSFTQPVTEIALCLGRERDLHALEARAPDAHTADYAGGAEPEALRRERSRFRRERPSHSAR